MKLKLVRKPDNNRDQSILWTASEDLGDGFTYIRTESDVGEIMDAWGGQIFDGALVSIYPNVSSDNEHWKLVPYSAPTHKLICVKQGRDGDYCVAVRDDQLVLILDPTRLWYKDSYDLGFVLVNKATDKPVQHFVVDQQLEVVSWPNCLDRSFLWRANEEIGGRGFTTIRILGDVEVVMDADKGLITDGSPISIAVDLKLDSQLWKVI